MNSLLIRLGMAVLSFSMPLAWGKHDLAAQVTADWRVLPNSQPVGRAWPAVAFDEVRGRLVLFGGLTATRYLDDTWEWDGTRWELRTPLVSPSARGYANMVYDASRQRIVLFGGAGYGGLTDDTWEWDGVRWLRIVTTSSPVARYQHSLTYDSSSRRVMMFGGFRPSGANDTWEYDGVNWRRVLSAAAPTPRGAHGAAYDSGRQRLVLFGGAASTDLWEFDGTNWSSIQPAGARPTVAGELAYDPARRRVVLYGGRSTSSPETWEWDGALWRQIPVIRDAGRRAGHRLNYDSTNQRVLMVGGVDPATELRTSSVAAYTGLTWSALAMPLATPLGEQICYDGVSNRPFSFGGGVRQVFGETVSFDGDSWQQLAPATRPNARRGHALVFDAARQEAVLFGGWSPPNFLGDLWVWRRDNWFRVAVSSPQPSPRMDSSAVYDAVRQRVVLFGGFGPGGGDLDDTWEWDGASWRQVVTQTTPGRWRGAAMAFDPDRSRVVLFGGSQLSGRFYGTTWEYDGVNWSAPVVGAEPPGRSDHDLRFDPVRRRIVLFGGRTSSVRFRDTWEWDGRRWLQVRSPNSPQVGRLVFDRSRARLLAFSDAGEAWAYASSSPPLLRGFGSGCAGTRGRSVVRAAPFDYPVSGRTFEVRIDGVGSGSPAALMVGGSRVRGPLGALPIDLTPIGMPGCQLVQSGEVALVSLGTVAGFARFQRRIPVDPVWVGRSFYLQGLSVDRGANPLGIVASPGLEARVGR